MSSQSIVLKKNDYLGRLGTNNAGDHKISALTYKFKF